MTSSKENMLLEQVAKGDEFAFRKLYDERHQHVYAFAFFLTRSAVLAEEVTQEIFIKLWIHREELLEILNFDAWFMTLVRNQSYRFLNRLARERLFLQKMTQKEEKRVNFTEQSVVFHEYERLLNEALSRLPSQQRKVFMLSRQEGLKHEDIAHRMGLSIHTVKNHMKAALRSVRVFMEEYSLILVAVISLLLLG